MVTDWVFEEFQAHKMYNEIPKKKIQIENQNSASTRMKRIPKKKIQTLTLKLLIYIYQQEAKHKLKKLNVTNLRRSCQPASGLTKPHRSTEQKMERAEMEN